jgi:diketogulonate reductase-like aldo/keto reductase
MLFDDRFDRREFLATLAALGVSNVAALKALAQDSMPLRRVPSTGEELPIIGLGSSKVVSEIGENGTAPVTAILRTLLEHGGRVIDTWPRNPANDSGFGRVLAEPEIAGRPFVTTKVSEDGAAGVDQLETSLRSYGMDTIDLAQVFSLTDLYTHWPTLKGWKESGKARYIGVTVSNYDLYDELETFLASETPDFMQVNYSISERRAEERLLPLAQDRGIAVIINRPFMNGEYFRRLANVPLPDWAAESGIHSWAEFSLKYILPHPALTTVLTETSNPAHMAENAMASYGAMPDDATRRRMAAYIDAL